MLSHQDNELITQTGPGTPMGEYLRRYWVPALLSREIPGPDSPPVRVKIMSEELVAFRDTNGDVGLLDNYCPHRRASLFFGRNEESGIRCVYHGWKFDVNGDCVDMPSEPAESNFRDKVKIKSYPARDWGGFIWAYMGPAELQPELPEVGFALVPDNQRRVSRRVQENNFVQGVEGGIDSSHISYLHFGLPPVRRDDPANVSLSNKDGAPHFTVKATDYGFVYGANREAEEDKYYWRLTPFMLPFFTIIPGGSGNPDERTYSGHGWVPQDDENCWMFTYTWNASRPLREDEGHSASFLELEPRTMRSVVNKDNDYGIDREAQRTKTFTGIKDISVQDASIQESMGPICDRTKEHLGTTDAAVIAMRRVYLKACRDLMEGVEPFVPRDGATFRLRSVAEVLDKSITFEETVERVMVGA